MSRGLGAVERFVLEFLASRFWSESTSAIVQILAKQRKVQPSASLEASVRRALAALLRKGLIRRDSNKNWRSVESEKREEERKRRESERARWRRRTESERRYREKMDGAQARPRQPDERQSPTRVLSKLLGMLGSDHDGEVLNAARKAEAERQRIGKTWKELLQA